MFFYQISCRAGAAFERGKNKKEEENENTAKFEYREA